MKQLTIMEKIKTGKKQGLLPTQSLNLAKNMTTYDKTFRVTIGKKKYGTWGDKTNYFIETVFTRFAKMVTDFFFYGFILVFLALLIVTM